MQKLDDVRASVDLFVAPSFGGNLVQITNLTGLHRQHPAKFS